MAGGMGKHLPLMLLLTLAAVLALISAEQSQQQSAQNPLQQLPRMPPGTRIRVRRPGPGMRGQILGVRRIQFTRRPPASATTPNPQAVDAPDWPVAEGAVNPLDTVTDDPILRTGDGAESDSEVLDGFDTRQHSAAGSSAPSAEEAERHWTYRRMFLQRERERLLHALPSAIETFPFPGSPGTASSSSAPDTAEDSDTNVDGQNSNNKNCTEYLVTEGTVRLCDEVHVVNTTTDSSTTTGSVMTAAEAEMEARQAAAENQQLYAPGEGGMMNGRDWIARQRYKQARLFLIQAMILQKLGIRQQPAVSDLGLSDDQRSHIMNAFRMYEEEMDQGAGAFQEEDGSYIRSLGLLMPSCELPKNTNRVWRDGSRFRLYFQVQPPAWRETKVATASLRIHKRVMQDCDNCYTHVQGIPEPLIDRNDRRRRHQRQRVQEHPFYRSVVSEDVTTASPLTAETELTDDSVLITVYSYSKSVKARRKEKVQEQASVVVRRDFEGWLKLDIKNAVTDWYHGMKNFGLLVRVFDHNQRELHPFSILTPANCTLNSNFSLPYPLSLTDSDNFNNTATESNSNVNQTTPYLDLVTLGRPNYDGPVRNRRNAAFARSFTPKENSHGRAPPYRQANLSTFLQWLGEKIMQSKMRIALRKSKRSIRQ